MNQLQVFNFKNREVRMVIINNEPWFVAKDVCDVLELTDASKTVSRLDEDEKLIRKLFVSGQNRDVTVINESGLYSLVLTSNKPEAKEFKHWITHDVIPAIRKTGTYSITQDSYMIEDPIARAERWIEEQKEKLLLKQKIQEDAPKVGYFNDLVERNLLTNFRDTAKELKIKEESFIGWILEKKYCYRDSKNKLKPYAQYSNSLFEMKEFVNKRNNHTGVQTMITPKGRETFRLLLEMEG